MTSWSTAIKARNIYITYIVLVVFYMVLAMLLPQTEATHKLLHLNNTQYHALLFAIILPYVIIWFAAFYAFAKLIDYTALVHNSKEGKAFELIARGVGVMALGLAVPAIINLLLKAIGEAHHGFRVPAMIINNYLTVLVPVIAFTLISEGSRRLTEIVKARPSRHGTRLLIVLLITFGVYYCYLTFRARFLHGNPYNLTMPLLIFTIIIPYLYAWATGLLGAYELSLYARKVRGLFYKRALGWLATGITALITGSIFVQYISSIYAYKANLSLNFLLIIVYLFLMIQAVGCISIAMGANRLKKIEDI